MGSRGWGLRLWATPSQGVGDVERTGIIGIMGKISTGPALLGVALRDLPDREPSLLSAGAADGGAGSCPASMDRLDIPGRMRIMEGMVAGAGHAEARRFRVAVAAVVAAAALLTGGRARAGWIEAEDGKAVIHITLWELPDREFTDTATRADLAAIAEFGRRFPKIFARRYRAKYKADPKRYGRHNWDNVAIELHQYSGIRVKGLEHDVLAIAGKVAPDVLYVNFRKSDNYIQNRFLYPLDKPEDGYMAGKGGMTDAEKKFRIHERIWPVIRRRGPDGKRHVWALPFGGAVGKALLFRKDLFDRAGVPYPTKDWTWEDMLDACRKITDPARGIYGLHLFPGKHESWNWVTFLWSAGGDVMTYDERLDKWRCVFDSRAAAKALDFYTRLCAEPWKDAAGVQRYGYVEMDDDPNTTKWMRGEVAMNLSYVEEKLLAKVNPDETGMVPVPLGPPRADGKRIRGGELNSRMMGLFAGIEDPVIRDAAWEYMRFFDSKDAVRIKTGVMVEGGFGRFINPMYLEMFGYEEIIRLSPKGWAECFQIAIDTSMPEPYGKNSNFAYDIMTEPMLKAREMAMHGQLPSWAPEDEEKRLDAMQALLREGVAKANREMLEEVPPAERFWRRVTAVAALVAMALIFLAVLWKFAKIFAAPPEPGAKRRGWGFRKYAVAYVILLPAVLSVFVWQYVPLVRGSVMAFQDYNVMGGSTWVGVDNFGDTLFNGDWWRAVWNSIRYSFLVIALTFLPPVVLAILLQEVPRGKILFRTIYYLPAVITGLVTVLLWKMFYDKSELGVLNAVMMNVPAIVYIVLGAVLLAIALAFARRLMYHQHPVMALCFAAVGAVLMYTCCRLAYPMLAQEGVAWYKAPFVSLAEPYRWLEDPDTAMFCCVLPMAWAGLGPGCLIYLAALKGIPDDSYEAADIDGATFADKVLFIVFPMLRALLIINFVGVFIGSWKATANILAMTTGGARTEVAGLHIFYKAFLFLKMGPATSMAWVMNPFIK